MSKYLPYDIWDVESSILKYAESLIAQAHADKFTLAQVHGIASAILSLLVDRDIEERANALRKRATAQLKALREFERTKLRLPWDYRGDFDFFDNDEDDEELE